MRKCFYQVYENILYVIIFQIFLLFKNISFGSIYLKNIRSEINIKILNKMLKRS